MQRKRARVDYDNSTRTLGGMQAAQAVADNAAVHFHILCALTGLGDAELDRAEADIAGQDGLARLAPPGAQVRAAAAPAAGPCCTFVQYRIGPARVLRS